jgi:hypothetical protein
VAALVRGGLSRHSSCPRWLGIATWLFVVIAASSGTPALGMPLSSTAPEVQKAELTVHRTGPIGFGVGQTDFPLRVAMPGQLFQGTATLVDKAGRNKVIVTNAKPAYCSGAERREIAVESSKATTATSEWCLKVHGLEPGSEATGMLSTPQAQLKLTLAVRHNYWFGPALVTLIALGFAAAGVLLGPDRLGGFVRRKRLQAALADNHQQLQISGRAIQGLDRHWVDKAGRAGADTASSTFVRTVLDLIDQGPDRADDERSTLKKHLESSTLDAAQPLRDAAEHEASKTTYQVSEFLDTKGTPVPHPASEWLMTITRAEALQAKFSTLNRSLDGMSQLNPAIKNMLERRLTAARAFFDAISDADGLDDVEDLADTLLLAINEAAGQQLPSEEAVGPERAARRQELPSTVASRAAGIAVSALARRLSRLEMHRTSRALVTERWWPTLLASGAILISIAFVMTIAAGSVAATSYVTTTTFGTTSDYLKLFFAALGSSVVIGVVTTILLWNPKPAQ